ncbi:hypothetical protein [Paenibacillus oleatilyticus]|uniref:hypothetical protein n=1 Tax=Paenibacillus oleatilyticus TaxID=2594886 RepID=UPI001C1FB9AE|nr:hypothetical protein [Paenibacillus oleatilyticus]MBU7316621.1 hypothetical protein [Paenibacillus oleatilyticus]
MSGTAFGNDDVTPDNDWDWGGPFNHNGTYHMWGSEGGGDAPVGVMKSTTFTMDGSGWIDFLVGGGNDIKKGRAFAAFFFLSIHIL